LLFFLFLLFLLFFLFSHISSFSSVLFSLVYFGWCFIELLLPRNKKIRSIGRGSTNNVYLWKYHLYHRCWHRRSSTLLFIVFVYVYSKGC
jgi:hypothetical protein